MVYYKQEEQGNMYSKQSYNYGRHGSKRKLKPIPVIITLLIVILILGGIYFLLFNGKNKYEDYNTYNETNKQYGTVQHYEKENDDFYISLYYPKLKEKNLNKIIKESYSTYLKSEKKKKDQKDILYLDYSCKKIYKQYVVVELDYKRINEASDVIVQIALRGRDVVLHGQHSRDQFLGGGLAVGSGQSYDSQTFAIHKSVLTMVTCESLQGLQRVRHDNQTGISRSSRCRTFIHHGITCPCLKSFESIFITIEIFAFQSEEHLAAADGTAVRRHTPAFQKCRI